VEPTRPHATILYHYFYPDDVVSARHLTDLAIGLAERGWQVTAAPSNRACRDEGAAYPPGGEVGGVRIRRVWRPGFRQASNRGRVLNAAWMLAAWSLKCLVGRRHRREVLIVGTDPVLSVLVALPWRVFRRSCGIAHWCFDLYPEAPIADGLLRADSRAVRVLRRLLAAAYRQCDLIADLGPCMAARLACYGSPARGVTLTPWALVEPPVPSEPDPGTRSELFGNARLGLLYSGSFGRAHSYDEFLGLARQLRNDSIQFCFAGRGNRMDELKAAVRPEDANVSFAGFAPESELERRLGACDLHLVSLRPEWTGTVVPSKFFGALAAGRGVLFAGSEQSAIARWIREHQVGWVLTPQALPSVADDLRRLAADPAQLAQLRSHCHVVYGEHFSKVRQLDAWDAELRTLL
jgi:glycosyltransferase involved in cell wall biosynthesis